MIKHYKKKPVVIAAVQFNGYNLDECYTFMVGKQSISAVVKRI